MQVMKGPACKFAYIWGNPASATSILEKYYFYKKQWHTAKGHFAAFPLIPAKVPSFTILKLVESSVNILKSAADWKMGFLPLLAVTQKSAYLNAPFTNLWCWHWENQLQVWVPNASYLVLAILVWTWTREAQLWSYSHTLRCNVLYKRHQDIMEQSCLKYGKSIWPQLLKSPPHDLVVPGLSFSIRLRNSWSSCPLLTKVNYFLHLAQVLGLHKNQPCPVCSGPLFMKNLEQRFSTGEPQHPGVLQHPLKGPRSSEEIN